MLELVDEHISARKVVRELVEAKNKYAEGDSKSVDTIIEKITFLIHFYPEHIKKEDLVFFPDTEKYFTKEELDAMLSEFRDFDSKMIHEKYTLLHESLSKKY